MTQPDLIQDLVWEIVAGALGQHRTKFIALQANPFAGLLHAGDGNSYGTTAAGGASNNGTLFEITPAGAETVLYSFAGGSDGRNPRTPLTLGTNGYFYGTTNTGGAHDAGTAFRY